MLDNKNFWLVADYIRLHFLAYERIMGTKGLLKTTRFLMKEYRRRKSYYGDTWDVFNKFLRDYVSPYIKNQMEVVYYGQDNVCSFEKYVSDYYKQANSK